MNVERSGGIGFVGLLQICFLVLKLCGVISWSWVWVLAPIWISAAIGILLILAIVIVAFAADNDQSDRFRT